MLGILKSKLIHLEGLFPASHWLDINIYQKIVKHILLPEERILADLSYYSEKTIIAPDNAIEPEVLTPIT